MGNCVEKVANETNFVKIARGVQMRKTVLVSFFALFFLTLASLASAKRVYTLSEAINQALSRSYLIKSVEENIKAAVEKEKSATSSMFPKVDFTYNYVRMKDVPYAKALGFKFNLGDKNSIKWNITITQPVFTGFALSSMREIAKLGIGLSKVYKREAVLSLAENVKMAYFNILLAKKYLKTAKEAVKQLKAHVRDAENFYKEGMIPLNDLLKSKVALASAVQQEVKAKNNLKVALSALNVALNNSVDKNIDVVDVDSFKPFKEPLDKLYQVAMSKSPLLKQVEIQLKQMGYAVKLAKSEYYPHVGVFAQYQRSGYNIFATDNPVSNDHNSMFGLQITWTLFDSFKTKHNVEEQEHKKFALFNRYLQLKKQVKLQVKQAYMDLKTAQTNIATALVGLRQAKENFRITDLRYKQGMTTSTEVLDARTYLTQAELNYYHAIYGYYMALAKLKKALGEY